MTQNIHGLLINLAKELGYFPTGTEGLCQGFVIRWLEASFGHDNIAFQERLDLLLSTPAPVLIRGINQAKKHARQRIELTSYEQSLLDLAAFVESTVLYLDPTLHTQLFNRPLHQANIEQITQFAASEKIEKLGGLVSIYSEPGIYTRDEIQIFLNDLENTINRIDYPAKTRIGFLFRSPNHTIGATYDTTEHRWELMDSGPPSKTNIASQLFNGFQPTNMPSYSYAAFTADVIIPAINDTCDYLSPLETQLKQLKQNHTITARIAKRKATVDLMWIAARDGDIKTVLKLHELGSDIHSPQVNGTTPLWIAAQNGQTDIVLKLAELGASIHTPDKYGQTPLWIAARTGQINVVIKLAELGAGIHSLVKGRTPLWIAARNGQADVVLILAKLGANVHTPNKEGITPLWIAAANGQTDVVIKLAELGAGIHSLVKGTTPLWIAAQNGHTDIVTKLAGLGASIHTPNDVGSPPILIAAAHGQTDVVIKLAELGADIHSPINGMTPLWIAAQEGHVDVVSKLAERGADVNALHLNYGLTPLWIAAQNGHADVVLKLAELGANINGMYINGNTTITPIWIAAQNGHTDVITKLMSLGADIHHSNDGVTPLWIAAEKGHVDAVKTLATQGADINTSDKNGATPLFIVAQEGHLDIVQFLLQHQAQTTPFISSADSLIALVQTHGPYVIKKMNDFIQEQSLQDGYSESEIPILPEKIAFIMGHDEVVNAFAVPRTTQDWKAKAAELQASDEKKPGPHKSPRIGSYDDES